MDKIYKYSLIIILLIISYMAGYFYVNYQDAERRVDFYVKTKQAGFSSYLLNLMEEIQIEGIELVVQPPLITKDYDMNIFQDKERYEQASKLAKIISFIYVISVLDAHDIKDNQINLATYSLQAKQLLSSNIELDLLEQRVSNSRKNYFFDRSEYKELSNETVEYLNQMRPRVPELLNFVHFVYKSYIKSAQVQGIGILDIHRLNSLPEIAFDSANYKNHLFDKIVICNKYKEFVENQHSPVVRCD